LVEKQALFSLILLRFAKSCKKHVNFIRFKILTDVAGICQIFCFAVVTAILIGKTAATRSGGIAQSLSASRP